MNSPHEGQWRKALTFFFDLRLNKRVSKQWWGWWFETPSRSLWRNCKGHRTIEFQRVFEIDGFVQNLRFSCPNPLKWCLSLSNVNAYPYGLFVPVFTSWVRRIIFDCQIESKRMSYGQIIPVLSPPSTVEILNGELNTFMAHHISSKQLFIGRIKMFSFNSNISIHWINGNVSIQIPCDSKWFIQLDYTASSNDDKSHYITHHTHTLQLRARVAFNIFLGF